MTITSPFDLAWDHAYGTDGAEFVALGLTNGATVQTFPDEVGTADLTQATSGSRPTYVTGVSAFAGKSVLRGNGGSVHMRTASRTAQPQPYTRVVIGLLHIDKAAGAFFDGLQASTKGAGAYIDNRHVHIDGGDNAGVTAPVNLSAEAPHIYEVLFDGANSKVWLDGRLVWTGTLAADQNEGLTIFDSAEISGALKALDGDIYFIGERITTGTNAGKLEDSERLDLVAWAVANAGCESERTGVRRLADAWSRAAAESDGSITKTLNRTAVAGEQIVVLMDANANHSTHGVTDNLGTPWVSGTHKKVGKDQGARGASIWVKVAVGGETSVTMSCTAGQFIVGEVEQVQGGVEVYITASGEDGGATTTSFPTAPSITTTAAQSLIYFLVHLNGNANEQSWSNGFHAHEGTTGRHHVGHKVVGPGTHTTAFVWSANQRALWAGIAIEAAAADLVVAGADHGHTSDSPALTQDHVLIVQDSSHAHTTDAAGALTQDHVLAADDSAHGNTADVPALTQVHALVAQDSAHESTSEAVVLTQGHVLAVQDSAHAHTSDTPALTQEHTLVVQDTSNGHASDVPSLTQAHTLAGVGDSEHQHTADAPALTQQHNLPPVDTSHGHTTEAVSLNMPGDLAVVDTSHTNTADTPTLTQVHVLIVQDTSNGHTSGVPPITTDTALAPADSLHGHASDAPSLSQQHDLVANDTSNQHVTDAVVLTQVITMVVDDTANGHTSETDVTLTEQIALIVQDTFHMHASEAVVIDEEGNAVPITSIILGGEINDTLTEQIAGDVGLTLRGEA